MQIESKLYSMMGKTYMYMNKNMKVLRYEVSDEETRIVTDARDIRFSNDNAKVKLGEFLEVAVEEPTVVYADPNDTPTGLQVQSMAMPNLLINTHGADLIRMAKENINLIMQDEGDEKKINKASAVNEQIKSVVDICKIEVEAMKVAAYVHKVHN